MLTLYARIRKFFTETNQTNWGKNQILKELDRILGVEDQENK